MKRYLYKVKRIAENLDWNVDIDDKDVTFQRYSGAGQDFFFSIKIEDDMADFCDEVYYYYEGFDVSYDFESIEQLSKEYWSDDIDMNVPANDAPITECEYKGTPLYFDTFIDLIKTFGIENDADKYREEV